MVVTGRAESVPLLGTAMLAAGLLLVMLPAGAAKPPAVGLPVGQGAEFTILSKTTTTDPFELRTDGPTRLKWAQVTVAPHGTTGLMDSAATTVVTVTQGAATALSSDGTGCPAGRSVRDRRSSGPPAPQGRFVTTTPNRWSSWSSP